MIRLMLYSLLISALTLVHYSPQEDRTSDVQPQEECGSCHGDLLERGFTHEVVSDACDNCHQPTGDPHPDEGSAGFTLVDILPDLCFYCHEEQSPGSFDHQPVKEKECLACHDVHGSDEPALLRMPEQELCFSCHQSLRQLVRGEGYTHTAVTEGGCSFCHLAHGSGNRALLTALYPAGDYVVAVPDSFELCFFCHDPALLEPGDAEGITGFRDGGLNLHHLHIQGDKGRNCRLCHNLHGSSNRFLIEERVLFGNWEMDMNFQILENGGSCRTGCHGVKSYGR